MNIERKMKLHMYLTVRIFLRANRSILAKLPNAQEFLKALDVAIADIQTYNALMEEGTKESKKQREDSKEALIAGLEDYSGKLTAYASYKEDGLLMECCNKSKSKLNGMQYLDLLQYSKTLYEKINVWIPELTTYYLTAQTQEHLLNLITDYEVRNPELTKAKSDYGKTKHSVEESYAKADAIMVKLDNEMEIIKVSDAAFVQQYKELRKVVINYDSNDVVFHILDAETGNGVPNAAVSFQLKDGSAAPIVKNTAEKGGLYVKTVVPGIYTVTVTKIGYEAQTITLTYTGDEQLVFDLKLVKTP